MGIASTRTKLPLATWAKTLGIHPLHFEQIEWQTDRRSPSICQQALFQHSWQEADRLSREEIAIAIATAESMLERYLGFRLVQSWEAEEWQLTTRPWRPEHLSFGGDVRGFAPSKPTDWGYFISGGIERKTFVSNEDIDWSDEDGDDEDDTGTVLVSVPEGTEACSVEIYYPEHEGNDLFQIRPARVVVSGTDATITFKRELAVIESLLNAFQPEAVDWGEDANFIETVDVYIKDNDPSQQAHLLWMPNNNSCSFCSGGGCSSCSYATQEACLYLKSTPKQAEVAFSPATWDEDEGTFTASTWALSRKPDLVKFWYRAGYRSPGGCARVMDDGWVRAVTYLSASLLDRPLCACANNNLAFWQMDLGLVSGDDQQQIWRAAAVRRAMDNPFGTRRGAVFAWQRCQEIDVPRTRAGALAG